MKIYLKTPLSYYGGKQMMLKDILPLIPKHNLYCEPFLGGGAVFWAKEPSPVEIINDTNGAVVNFYRVVQSKFDELYNEVQLTLHARTLYNDARVVYNNPHLFSDVKRAWALWVATSQSFASKIGSGWAYARKKNSCEKKVTNAKKRFQEAYKERLNYVQIECNNALNVIKSRDSEDSFFYIDPPYVGSNQGHYSGYTQEDFNNLITLLSSIKGKFLLSSYPNKYLDEAINKYGWNTKKFDKCLSASKNRNARKTEVLTKNY